MKLIKYILLPLFVVFILLVLVAFGCSIMDQQKGTPAEYTVTTTWQMPAVLNELSGVSWISDHEVACIQDEDGYIFIYDLKQRKISQKIKFADAGDYEGIAIRNKDAYVMRSDGDIFEVLRFRESGTKQDLLETLVDISSTVNRESKLYQTPFSGKNNMETLFLDPVNDVLLTIPKERDLDGDDYKKIYEVRFKNTDEAVLKSRIEISMNDDALIDFKKKKTYKTFNPSDMAIHPTTGEYYVLEGTQPKLVILNKNGTIKRVVLLDSSNFPQPEGITFSPDGTLYIATEAGGNYTAMLHEVEINKIGQ
jgi:uncharacterized protein YjiK